VTSYDFSSSQQLSIGSQSSGSGAGTASLAPLVVTTVPGPQTAGLFADLASGGAFSTAELVVPGQPAGSSLLDVTFTQVRLQKIEESSSTGAVEPPGLAGPSLAGPVETLSFGYSSLAFAPSGSSSSSSSAVR